MSEIDNPGKFAAVRPVGEAEILFANNLFVEFIGENRDDFTAFSSLHREARQTYRAWKEAFIPIKVTIMKSAQAAIGLTSKKTAGIESRFEQMALHQSHSISAVDVEFDDEEELEEEKDGRSIYSMDETELTIASASRSANIKADLGRSPSNGVNLMDEWQDVVMKFNLDYNVAILPTIDELKRVNSILWDKTVSYMLSSYQAMLDMLEVLSNPKYGKEKDEISGFFRNVGAGDEALRQRGNESLTMHVRQEWQNGARTQFDPVVFDRFWESSKKSGKAKDIIEWVTFGARIAKAQRDETKIEELTLHDIESVIGRVPFELWPRQLREVYSAYGIQDAALVIAQIREKWKVLFPPTQNKPIQGDRPNSTPLENRKRKSYLSAPHKDSGWGETETQANSTGETIIENRHNLALVKVDAGRSRNSHYFSDVPREKEQYEISRLASAGRTPAMQRDLAKVIERLLSDPLVLYGPATSKLSGHWVSLKDMKREPIRRVDPKKISDISYEDAETRHARVVCTISDNNTVAIVGVYPTHELYEQGIEDNFH